ncbi:hypothetical protein EQV77_09120 [Halobacillus fulvus]|nr:hypothetical protein EQV77_09120 [Halobacillus fulvus]
MYNKLIIKKYVNSFLYLLTIVFLLFVPTSINGEFLEINNVKIISLLLISILLVCLNGNLSKVKMVIFLGVQLVFWGFTLINLLRGVTHYTWNLGSYSILTIITFLFIFNFKSTIDLKLNKLIFNLTNIIIIVWGLGLVFDVSFINNLTISYYSQYTGWTIYNMLENNKPILSFGTHSFSALFIFFMIILNKLYSDTDRLNAVFIVFYIFLLLMTQSTTSFGLLILILLYVVSKFSSNKKGLLYILFVFLLCTLSTIIFLQGDLLNTLLDRYDGLSSRYSTMMFDETWEVIKANIALGVLVPSGNSITLIDSGIINFMFKGNIFLLVFFYLLFYWFAKKNLREYYIHFFIVFILFEIGVSFFAMDVRSLALIIFILLTVNSAPKYNNAYEYTNEKRVSYEV